MPDLIAALYVLTMPLLCALFGWWLRGWADRRRANRMYENICAEIERRESAAEWPEVING